MKIRVHLDSWIIQDGNYEDFAVNQKRDFALEYWSVNGLRSTTSDESKSFQLVGDSSVDIKANVILVNDDWHAIDFGIRAFRESPPPQSVRQGQHVSGKIELGIDPFFYREYLHKSNNGHPLIYSWSINRVRIQTAPLIECNESGNEKVFIRDPDQLGWKDIQKTDAWNDDEGNASYLLDVSLADMKAIG